MKRWMGVLLAVCLLLFSTSCQFFSSKVPGEGATIQYHLPETVTSIDPQTVNSFSARTVVLALYEGLCRVNAENELLPGVAERWEHNAAYTEYTFYLRQDAVWNNGEPVLADDFVFAFTRALDQNTGSQDVRYLFGIKNAQAIYRGEASASSLGAVALDDHTLRITLETADDAFPYMTAKAVFMPCSRAFFEQTKGRYGLTYGTSCTNGPFSFVNRYSWEARKSMSLCASYSYAGEAVVYPDFIEFTMGTKNAYTDALHALLDGAVDMCEIPSADVEEAWMAGCTVDEIENTTYGIMLNPQTEILSVPAIRQMMFAAVNPQTLTPMMGDSMAIGVIPMDVLWGDGRYRDQVSACVLPAHSVDATVDLLPILTENGLDSMTSMTIICGDDSLSKAVANELIITWNTAFGTYFNMLPLSQDELQSRIAAGDYQICLADVVADKYDPYSFLMQIASMCPDEELIVKIESASTAEAFYAVEQYLLDQGLFYPLCSDCSYFAQAPQVSGAYVSMLTALDFTSTLKSRK